jgi:hypothetical protein
MGMRNHSLRPGHVASRTQNRLALEQLEARLAFAIDGIEANLEMLTNPSVGATPVVGNAAPTIVNAPRLSSGTEVRTRTVTASVLGADDQGEANLRYTWQVASQPAPNSVTFATNGSNAAKNNSLTFSRPGNYSVNVNVRDNFGATTTRVLQFSVVAALAELRVKTSDGRVVTKDAPIAVSATTARFTVQALDQFSTTLASQPKVTWQTVSTPTGGTATFQNETGGAKVTFNRAGLYKLRIQSGSQSFNFSVNVTQVLRSLQLTTPSGTVVPANQTLNVADASQRLNVRGLDQFNQSMTSLPNITWTTSSAPADGRLTTTFANGVATLNFNRLGNYQIRAVAGGAAFSFTAQVIPTLTSIRATTVSSRLLSPTTAVGLNVTTAPLNATGMDQFGAPLAQQPVIAWQATTKPEEATVSLVPGSNAATATFSRAGIYGFRATSGSRTLNVSINVTQALTTLVIAKPDGTKINANGSLAIDSASQELSVRGLDQFRNAMLTAPNVTWSATSQPADARFTGATSAGIATLRFTKLGSYSIRATSGAVAFDFNVNIQSALGGFRFTSGDSLAIPDSNQVRLNASSKTFTAIAIDQFNVALEQQPDLTWSVASSPTGGKASLETEGNAVTATFDRLGTYVLLVQGGERTGTLTVEVVQGATSFTIETSPGVPFVDSESLSVANNQVQLSIKAFDQFDAPMSSLPSMPFTVVSSPSGGSATATTSSDTMTISFTRAGNYSARIQVGSATKELTFAVQQTLTRTVAISENGQTLTSGNAVSITKARQVLRARALDQFGQELAQQPAYTWSIVSQPTTDAAEIISSNEEVAAQFTRPGRYVFRATAGDQTVELISNVVQSLTRINVTPGTSRLEYRATQLFAASARDQFDSPMATTPTFTWSATGGTITSAGSFNSGAVAGNFVVRANVGSITGSATVTVAAPVPQTSLRDEEVKSLVESFYADSRIDRQEMIDILRSAGDDGIVDATELADFRFLVSIDSSFQMPDYVRGLAKDVVTDNPANLKFKGQNAGNLVAGSASSLLNNLVSKWFLGADHPALTGTGLSYQTATGTLFATTPSRSDARQGMLGDCYFIASVVAIADRNPQAVRNLFIDNGDDTFTVRFFGGTLGYRFVDGNYTAGFSSGSGEADYVTVDRRLPAYSNGMLAYSGYGQSVTSATTTLWIALAEKAYAQWNETRNAGRDGTNQYASIEGGWMSNVNAQVLGYNSTNYAFSSTPKQTLVNALAAGRAVTLGTLSAPSAGFVGGHAYIITGYDPSSDRFSVYNPWGNTHPAPVSWAQLQANCSLFVVTDPSGSQSFNAVNVHSSIDEQLIGSWTQVVSNEPINDQDESNAPAFGIDLEASASMVCETFAAEDTTSVVDNDAPIDIALSHASSTRGALQLEVSLDRLEALDFIMANLST